MDGSSRCIDLVPVNGGVMLSSDNYAVIAEQIMSLESRERSFQHLSVSKLRRIYSLIMNLYTRINVPEDFEIHKKDLQYLKVKMAYEAGRERAVRYFLEKTQLMKAIDAVSTYEQFMLYCRYAESLVAYFKFFGGKE